MILAAVGDIHGNLPALEAVLEAIDEAGIHTIVNTGDCVVGFPWPNEAVDLLRRREILTVQGERDRFAVRFLRKQQTLRKKWSDAEFRALQWTHETARTDTLEYLRSLPRRGYLHLEGLDITVCHGTLASQSEGLHPNDPESRFRRQWEEARSHLVILGRTHIPFQRWLENTLFVNPGSVGMNEDGAARYALINTETTPWSVEFREARYDTQMVTDRLSALGLEPL